MNLLLSGLYIGSFNDARDEAQLDKHGITHVLSLVLFGKPLSLNRHYLCVKVNDNSTANIGQYFTVCNNFIHNARTDDPENHNVLIHCYQGYSRAPTVAIAYLMTVAELNFDAAWRVVRSVRLGARPNLFFQQQLKYFELNELSTERARLRSRFPGNEPYTLDSLTCAAVLDNYDFLLMERMRIRNSAERLLGLESQSGTERYSETTDTGNDSDTESEFEREHETGRNHDRKKTNVKKMLQQLRSTLSRVSLSSYEEQILMPNVVYYRPLKSTEDSPV